MDLKAWSLAGERTSLGMCLGLVYLIFRPFLSVCCPVRAKKNFSTMTRNFSVMMFCHHRLVAMKQLTTDWNYKSKSSSRLFFLSCDKKPTKTECYFSCGLFCRGYWPWSGFVMLVPEDTGIWMLEVEEIPGSFIHPVDIWVHTPLIHLPLPRAPLPLSSAEDLSILRHREGSQFADMLPIRPSIFHFKNLYSLYLYPLHWPICSFFCISDIPLLGNITSIIESYSEKHNVL